MMAAMPRPDAALERIEAGLRATSSFGREVVRVSGFTVAIATGGAAGLAVAVPEANEVDDVDAALAAVERTFASAGLAPNIEYVEELHPRLAEQAARRGWRTSMRAPVMVLGGDAGDGAAEAVATLAPTARLHRLTADGDRLVPYLRGQHRAYGGDPDGDALGWLPVLRAGLAAGVVAAVALEVDDAIVAGASVQMGAGVGELAGVWTLPEARRRGYALAACGALLQQVASTGLEAVWLSAAPDATALYERLGFRRVGTQRNLDRPSP